MKKVKSLKALVLSLMLCLAMGTTAFASEVSTQGQAAPNANKAVEVSDCGDLDVVPAYDDAVALADTIQYDANEPLQEAIPEAVYSTEIIITPLITQALQSCA